MLYISLTPKTTSVQLKGYWSPAYPKGVGNEYPCHLSGKCPPLLDQKLPKPRTENGPRNVSGAKPRTDLKISNDINFNLPPMGAAGAGTGATGATGAGCEKAPGISSASTWFSGCQAWLVRTTKKNISMKMLERVPESHEKASIIKIRISK